MNKFKIKSLFAVFSFYKKVIPFLFSLAVFFLFIWAFSFIFFNDPFQSIGGVGLLCLVGGASRIILLIFVDMTMFRAIDPLYIGAAYSLYMIFIGCFCLVGPHLTIGLLRELGKRVHLKHRYSVDNVS